MRAILFLLAVLIAAPALALEPGEALENPADEARARALMEELRCLVCQNESIDASPSPFAGEVRQIVREQIAAGRSEREVKDYLTARYGDAILFRPRMGASTFLLWLGPLILLIGGGAAVMIIISSATKSPEPETLSDEEASQIQDRLDQLK